MLFSRKEIAEHINDHFEPVWESVRPVPIVRVDFGNGNVVTRTLHGNIATYVCKPGGEVLDVLPGIYEPVAYLDRLVEFSNLYKWAKVGDDGGARYIADYHRTRAAALAGGEEIAEVFDPADFSKYIVESRLKEKLLVVARREGLKHSVESENAVTAGPLESAADVALWKSLEEDTRINESTRRRMVHERLAAAGLVPPGDLTKWLYREVLHADLDDPYLGLGETLFASYPFREEDER